MFSFSALSSVSRLLVGGCLLVTFSVAFAAEENADLLPPELRSWVEQQGGRFKIGLESTYYPYTFIDEAGNASGIAGDYMRLLEQHLGIEFEIVESPSFAETLRMAREREIDIVPFVVAEIGRRDYLEFTQPIHYIQDHLFTRSEFANVLELKDLAELRTGYISGYVGDVERYLSSAGFDASPIDDERQAVLALSTGEIDALIADSGSVSYYIQQLSITNIRMARAFDVPDPQSFAIRSDWPQLRNVIDIGISNISSEERQAIADRWFSLNSELGQIDNLRDQIQLLFIILVIIAASFIGIFTWNYSLRRLVAVKIVELQSELEERRRVEDENTRLAAAIDQSAEYVVIIDENNQTEYANNALVNLNKSFLRESHEFSDTVYELDRDVVVDAMAGLEPGQNWRGKVRFKSHSDEPVTVLLTITKTIDHAGRLGYIATGTDVSHAEELEFRLRQGEKASALGTLAGGIAHDFNNLLVPILGYSDILKMRGENTRAVESIQKAALRAQQLVQRILAFSRFNNEGDLTPVNLTEVISEGITFLRSLIPSTVVIESEINEELFTRGNKSDIQQILLNLATNASDAMDAQAGLLKVKLDLYELKSAENLQVSELVPGTYCRLLVADDGKGMTPEHVDRMFDPYFSDKPQGKGTGLGLATVRGIVKSMQGGIRVMSTPNIGTSIEVFLPLCEDREFEELEPDLEPLVSSSLSRVLLVDDDRQVLDTVEEMLKVLGYEPIAFADPVAALQAFEEDPQAYSLLLSDFTMPGLTGLQLAKAAQGVRSSLPVILMTGKTDLLADVDLPSIRKPFVMKELATCLSALKPS